MLAHTSLREFLKISSHSRHKIGIVSLGADLSIFRRGFPFCPPLRTVLTQFYVAFKAAVKAFKMRHDHDHIIFLEYFDQYQIFTLPLLLPVRKKLFFLMNHNQQRASVSPVHRFFFSLFSSCPFRFLQMELDPSAPRFPSLPPQKRLIVPHPVSIDEAEFSFIMKTRSQNTRRLRIGITGKIRKGKDLLFLVHRLSADIERTGLPVDLTIGLQSSSRAFSSLKQEGYHVQRTDRREEYLKCLASIDISIQWFEKEHYFVRPSGTIMDAACSGCYVLCPDYPLLSHQVTWPTALGSTFHGYEDLFPNLIRVLENFSPPERSKIDTYRKNRDARTIARLFDDFIEKHQGPD
jgi:hypothetical protein